MIRKAQNGLEFLRDRMQEEHDNIYNDYAMRAPGANRQANIAQQYFNRAPTIQNLSKGVYHWVQSDPLRLYGAWQEIKQDIRRFNRENNRKQAKFDSELSKGQYLEALQTLFRKSGGTLTINNIKNMENQYEKYQLGGFFKKLFGGNSRGGVFGGGEYGGGGAGGRWDDSEAHRKKEDDRYNVREQTVVVVPKKEEAKPTPKPSSRKPSPKRPSTKKAPVSPNQELEEVVVISQKPTLRTNFVPKLEPDLEIENPQIHVPVNPYYNRKATRQFIRARGLNPYHVGSLQRRQLRKYLNGKLTEDQVSPTVLAMAQQAIEPGNEVWSNYYPDNEPRSGIVHDVKEFFRPTVNKFGGTLTINNTSL